MVEEQQQPCEIFYFYAQKDEDLCEELDKHLRQLKQDHQIVAWDRRNVLAGGQLLQETEAHLNAAQIILLLMSADFLEDMLSSSEMQRVLERGQDGSARVIPIIVRSCDWEHSPFAQFKPLPADGAPIAEQKHRDKAFLSVAQGIRQVLEDMKKRAGGQREQASPVIRPQEQAAKPGGVASVSQSRPATLFLGYAHHERERVKDLRLRLKLRGLGIWQDKNPALESLNKSELVRIIEEKVDALVLFITPDSLKLPAPWKYLLPAARQRHNKQREFQIFPILYGVSPAEFQGWCTDQKWPQLAYFPTCVIADGGQEGAEEEQNKQLNEAARMILQAAFSQHLRNRGADATYEPHICLQGYPLAPAASLDLDLDWTGIIGGEERYLAIRDWNRLFLPALLDMKQIVSREITSRSLHLYIKIQLPIAIAFGFAFREPAKIRLMLEREKGETWRTDVVPSEEEPCRYEMVYNRRDLQVAVIEVSVSRDIQRSVASAIDSLSLAPDHYSRLVVQPEPSLTAVKSAAHAIAIASQVGRVCRELRDQRGVSRIHLFTAVPVELGVLIGHQLNAMCPITLYDWDGGMYKQVGTLS